MPRCLRILCFTTIVLGVLHAPVASIARAGEGEPTEGQDNTGHDKTGHEKTDGEFELGIDVRPGDEVWMLSTRHIPCGYVGDPTVYRLGATRWDDAELFQLNHSLQQASEIAVYVHGNRMNFQQAADRGRDYYAQLAAAGGPPIRFIIWSWPSDQIKGQLRDVRMKATRADYEGALLADFYATLPQGPSRTLIGYSYGARVISGALANESISASGGPKVRGVFLAPAVDVNWLGPNNRQSGAWFAMNRLMVLYNTCDPALKRFRFSDACYQPTALGYVGPWWVGQTPGVVDAENVSGIVGKSHNELNYLNSGYLMNRMRGFLDPRLLAEADLEAGADAVGNVEIVDTGGTAEVAATEISPMAVSSAKSASESATGLAGKTSDSLESVGNSAPASCDPAP